MCFHPVTSSGLIAVLCFYQAIASPLEFMRRDSPMESQTPQGLAPSGHGYDNAISSVDAEASASSAPLTNARPIDPTNFLTGTATSPTRTYSQSLSTPLSTSIKQLELRDDDSKYAALDAFISDELQHLQQMSSYPPSIVSVVKPSDTTMVATPSPSTVGNIMQSALPAVTPEAKSDAEQNADVADSEDVASESNGGHTIEHEALRQPHAFAQLQNHIPCMAHCIEEFGPKCRDAMEYCESEFFF